MILAVVEAIFLQLRNGVRTRDLAIPVLLFNQLIYDATYFYLTYT